MLPLEVKLPFSTDMMTSVCASFFAVVAFKELRVIGKKKETKREKGSGRKGKFRQKKEIERKEFLYGCRERIKKRMSTMVE